MKNNTIRVHQNGATKPASAQTKIPRRPVRKKSGPVNKSVAVNLTPAPFSILELESAQYQSNALLELLTQALHSESGPDWSKSLGAGLMELVLHTQKRLESAFEKTQAALYQKLPQVAS